MTRAKVVCASCGKLLGWGQTDDGDPAFELCLRCMSVAMDMDWEPKVNGAIVWLLIFLAAGFIGALAGIFAGARIGALCALSFAGTITVWLVRGKR